MVNLTDIYDRSINISLNATRFSPRPDRDKWRGARKIIINT